MLRVVHKTEKSRQKIAYEANVKVCHFLNKQIWISSDGEIPGEVIHINEFSIVSTRVSFFQLTVPCSGAFSTASNLLFSSPFSSSRSDILTK